MEMKIPEVHKKTEVGVIPDDWDVQKLKDCLIKNPDYGINAPAVPYSDNLPTYIRITDISEDGNFLHDNKSSVIHHNSHNYFLEVDDIVLARTGASTGKSYLYNIKDGKLVFAGFLIRVKPDPQKLCSRYLKGYLETQAYWNWVKIMSMRSGQPGINGNEYGQLKIPLPPLPEQKAIAQSLSDVDTLITAWDQVITKKRNIKQSTMQQILTGKKRLPGFSDEWEVKKLGGLVEFSNGKAHENSITENGKFIVINSKFISTEGQVKKYSNFCYCPVSIGEIVMVMSDVPNGKALAKCFYINENDKYTLNQRICSLTPLNVNSDFLFYLLDRNSYYLTFDDGVKQTNLRKDDVLSCPLKLPVTLEEQQAIAQVLSDMDAEIEALEKKRDKYKAIKQGMMQELLTGKTRLISSS